MYFKQFLFTSSSIFTQRQNKSINKQTKKQTIYSNQQTNKNNQQSFLNFLSLIHIHSYTHFLITQVFSCIEILTKKLKQRSKTLLKSNQVFFFEKQRQANPLCYPNKMDLNNKKKISLLQCFFKGKTVYCNHNGSCFRNAIQGLLQSFGLGFIIKSAVHILTCLISKKKQQNLIQGFFQKDFYYLSLFFCSQTCLLKAIQCLLRLITQKESGFNSFLSGFLASYAAMYFYQNKTNLYNWRMLAYMRVIEGIYYQLVNRGYIQKKSLHFSLMYSIGSFLLSYSTFHESRIALPDVIKLYGTFQNLTPDEKIFHYVMLEKAQKKFEAQGLE
ncbi:hypothetical protein ABPG72_021308 [Tetrahymena utriculariae]